MAARYDSLITLGPRDLEAAPGQIQALLDLFAATDGPRWAQPWPVDSRDTSYNRPCGDGWAGVTCDENGRVVRLELASRRLSGTIPASLCRHLGASLTLLDLSHNFLTGTRPETAGCSGAFVDLSDNRFA